MLEKLKAILNSSKTDAQKLAAIRSLCKVSFTADEILPMLKGSIGKIIVRLPEKGMTPEQLKEILRESSVHPNDFERFTEVEPLLQVIERYSSNHIEATSAIGKRVYNLASGKFNQKPETIAKVLQEMGLASGFEVAFTIDDGYRPNEAVEVNGNLGRLLSKPNMYQWLVELVIDGKKQVRPIEVRDIKRV